MTEKSLNVSSPTSFGSGLQKNRAGCQLQESTENVSMNYSKLSKHICELIIRCADTLDIRHEIGVGENSDLSHIFAVLKSYLEKVLQAYAVTNQEVKSAKDEINSIRAENSAKIKLISDIETRLSSCKKQLEMYRSGNSILEQRNEMFRKQLEKYKKDVRRMNREHAKTKTSLDSLQRQYEQTKLVYDEKVKQLSAENATLESEMTDMRKEMKNLLEDQSCFERNNRKISELMEELDEKSMKISELERTNAKLLTNLNMHAQSCRSSDSNRRKDLGEKASDEGCVCGESESDSRDQISFTGVRMKKNEKLEQYLTRIEAELSEKIVQNHELERSLAASENKTWELEEKLTEITRRHENIRHQHEALESQLNKGRHEVCHCLSADAGLATGYADLQHRYEAQNTALKYEIETLRSQSKKLETQIRSLLKSTFATQDCGRGDEILPKELDNPMEYLQERIISLLSTNSHLSKTSVELRSLVSDLKERGGDLRKTSEELNTVCEKLKTDLMQSEKKVHSLEAENFNYSEMIVRLNKKIAGLRVTGHIESIDCKAKDPQHDVMTKLNSVTAERDKLVGEIALLKEKEENLDYALRELQGEVDAHQSLEEDLKAKVIDSEKYILKISEEMTKLQTRVGESDAFANCLKKEKEQLNEALQKISQSSAKKKAKIAALQKENFELMSQIGTLNKELSSVQSMKTEFKLYEEQNTFLKQELNEKEDDMKKSSNEIDRLNRLVESQKEVEQKLHEDLIARDEQITQLEAKLSECDRAEEQNEDTIQDLQQLLDETLAEYKSFSESQKNAVKSFEERINILDKEKTTLESTNKVLLEKAIKLGANLRESQCVNADLLVQLKNAKENAVRDSDLVNLQLKYVALCAEKEKLETSKSQLENTCEQLFKRIEMLTVQMKNLQQSAQILEDCNENSRSEIEALRKAFNRNRQQNEDLQRKLQFVQSKLRATNCELASLEELCEKGSACTAVLNDQVGQLHTQVENTYPQMEHDLQLATDNVVNLKKLYEREAEKSNVLKNEVIRLGELVDAKQAEVDDQNNVLSDIKMDFEEKLETIMKISQELLSFKHMNESLQEENSQLLQKIELMSFLEKNLEEAQKSIALLKEENSSYKQQIEELSSTKAALAKEVVKLVHTIRELESQVEKRSSALNETKSALDAKQTENSQLEQAMDQLKADMNSLHEVLEKPSEISTSLYSNSTSESRPAHLRLLDSIVELRGCNDNLQEQNMKLSADLDSSRQDNSQLLQQLSDITANFKCLENEHISLCSDLHDLQERCRSLTCEKEAAQEEKQDILASLNDLEIRRNEMIRQQVSFNEELNEKLRQYESLQDELESLKAEKQGRENELLVQGEQLSQFEEKLNSIEEKARLEEELNNRQKRDVAILQAKLLKSRQTTQENVKQWEYERSKLVSRIQDAEKRIKDNNSDIKNKFECMRNKMTQCSTLSLSKIDLLDAFVHNGGKSTDNTSRSLQILSYSELETTDYMPSSETSWKKRIRYVKYPVAIVVFNMILAFLLKYTLSKNNLEVIVRRTVPSILDTVS